MSSLPHHEIYSSYAEKYDLLRSRMDYKNNLFKKLSEIVSFEKADVVEFAAGTGLLTTMVVPLAKSVKAFDLYEHMLDFAMQKLEKLNVDNWELEIADNRSIPLEDNCADIVLEGWSLGYIVGSYWESREIEIEKVLKEMRRLVKKGGTIITIGTLGTVLESPLIPNEGLEFLYTTLEQEGFKKEVVRTDYKFMSVEEAEDLISFLWTEELGNFVKEQKMTIVPEHTGIWYLKV